MVKLKFLRLLRVSIIPFTVPKEYLIGNMLMSLESTTNRMLRIAQSMIYFNKIKTIEETVKYIQAVTAKDIRDLSNEIFENGTLTRVILSSKNLLLQQVS